MDWSVLRIAGLILLGWTILSVVVGLGVAQFMRAAHHLERHIRDDSEAISDWVHGRKPPKAA
jgi:hypothetical protein